MSKSTIHYHLLQYHITDLNLHLATNGHGEEHWKLTLIDIYHHLPNVKAPTKFAIKNNKYYNVYKLNISEFS